MCRGSKGKPHDLGGCGSVQRELCPESWGSRGMDLCGLQWEQGEPEENEAGRAGRQASTGEESRGGRGAQGTMEPLS